MNGFYGFRATLLLDLGDVDGAHVAIRHPDDGTPAFASVALGDLTLMPSLGADLSTVLRQLADRIDTAMTAAANEPKAVA